MLVAAGFWFLFERGFLMSGKHTSLPWYVGERTRWVVDEATMVRTSEDKSGVIGATSRGDADFIVRAVNSHDDLLELLKTVLIRLDLEAEERAASGRSPEFPCAAMREDIRSAIARAEA